MNEKTIYQMALANWGEKSQVNMAIEECAELIKVLVKYGRKINSSSDVDVQSEIADVQIMLNQLKIIFDENAIEKIKTKKLKRLVKLIRENDIIGKR